MKILAIGRDVPGVSGEQFMPHVPAEAQHVWQLYMAGVLREIYFRQDVQNAVLVLECADMDEAQRVLNELPMVREGLITFEIIPLGPYPGFGLVGASGQR